MRIFLDTCYLIYLMYAQEDDIHRYCIDLLKKLDEHEPITNMLVLNEATWILKKKYKIPTSDIFEFLDKISEFVTIVPIDQEDYSRMKKFVMHYGMKPSDALHVSTMIKAKTDCIITEDRDFDKIRWIRRVWVDHAQIP